MRLVAFISLFATSIYGIKCPKHKTWSPAKQKCVTTCEIDLTVCIDVDIFARYFKNMVDFGVTCSSEINNEGCKCDAKKGLFKIDPLDKFSKCKGPKKWCDNLEFQEYVCSDNIGGGKTCTCVDKNECNDPENKCFKNRLVCIDQTFGVENEGLKHKGYKCGEAPKLHEVLDENANEYVCEDGFARNALKTCKEVVECGPDSCSSDMKCSSVNRFNLKCECILPHQVKTDDQQSCKCKSGFIEINGVCVKHIINCPECTGLQDCIPSTATTQAKCESKCKLSISEYQARNQTCDGVSGTVKCVEGFEVKQNTEVKNGEIHKDVQLVCEETTSIASMYVIGIGVAIAIILGLILFIRNRQTKKDGHTAGESQRA